MTDLLRDRELEVERRRELEKKRESLREIERRLQDHDGAEQRREEASRGLDEALRAYDPAQAGTLRRRIDKLLSTEDPGSVLEKVRRPIPGAERPLRDLILETKQTLDGAAAADLRARVEHLRTECHQMGMQIRSLRNLDQAIRDAWKVLSTEQKSGLPGTQIELVEALVNQRGRSSSLER